MKLISLSILFFLTLSAFAQAPEQGNKAKKSKTEQVQPKLDAKADEKPSVESPAKKQRIPVQLDIFLPVVSNKYEPTA